MRPLGQHDFNRILRCNHAAYRDDGHHAGPEGWPRRSVQQPVLQSGLEAIDEHTWCTEAGKTNDRGGTDPEFGVKRQAFEIEP